MNTTRENLITTISVFCFFLLFLFNWTTNAGLYVYGIYSEVDGQYFAWISRFIVQWGKPLDMNTFNPFQGMGSVFIPVNSWWNLGALVLGLPYNKLTNFLLSYSIYWVEIFLATYFLAKTIGLNKIESILAAEVFVLFLFPPFSAYFNTIPYFSIAPTFAHLMAVACVMIIAYVKLGEGSIAYNIFLVLSLIFLTYLILMISGLTFIIFVPIYTLLALGFTIRNFNRKHLLWKMGALLLIGFFFLIMHGMLYYETTAAYTSAAIDMPKTTFSMPHVWQPHLSIFYGSPPLYSLLHIFALLGGIVGIFCQNGKYRSIAFSFVLIALLPDVMGLLLETGTIYGNINQINIGYYLWSAYPLFCIFFIIFISFLWRQVSRMLVFLLHKLPINLAKRESTSALNYLKLLTSLIIIPVLATTIWFNHFHKHQVRLKEPKKTQIVGYLEQQIGINPGDVFRGETSAYFASKNSTLRPLLEQHPEMMAAGVTGFSAHHYILSREFLSNHFENRYMFSDLWNYKIPTLEEYGQWITLPMYVFFREMLGEKNSIFDRHFLNIFKLDLTVLRAMGVRYVITDKILHAKNISLVMVEEQKNPMQHGYVDYNVSVSAKKILEELSHEFKAGPMTTTNFINAFNKKLQKIYPGKQQEIELMDGYLLSTINSAEGPGENWQYTDMKKINTYFTIVMFTWTASPPVYLYEIKNPNLATYSPTHLIQVNSANELFLQMKKPSFDFEKSAILTSYLPITIASQLKKVNSSEMRFKRNAVQIKAESDGWSLLLLPLQYSHCFRIINESPTFSNAKSVQFVRANLINGAFIFKKKLDATLVFDFGIGRNVNCRKKDIKDMKSIGLI